MVPLKLQKLQSLPIGKMTAMILYLANCLTKLKKLYFTLFTLEKSYSKSFKSSSFRLFDSVAQIFYDSSWVFALCKRTETVCGTYMALWIFHLWIYLSPHPKTFGENGQCWYSRASLLKSRNFWHKLKNKGWKFGVLY